MGRLLRFVLRGQNSLMHKLCDALDLKNMTLKKFGQCLLNKAGTFSRLTFTRFQYNILLTGYENRRACQLEHVIIIQNQVLLSYFQGNVRHSKGRITSWILGLKGLKKFFGYKSKPTIIAVSPRSVNINLFCVNSPMYVCLLCRHLFQCLCFDRFKFLIYGCLQLRRFSGWPKVSFHHS